MAFSMVTTVEKTIQEIHQIKQIKLVQAHSESTVRTFEDLTPSFSARFAEAGVRPKSEVLPVPPIDFLLNKISRPASPISLLSGIFSIDPEGNTTVFDSSQRPISISSPSPPLSSRSDSPSPPASDDSSTDSQNPTGPNSPFSEPTNYSYPSYQKQPCPLTLPEENDTPRLVPTRIKKGQQFGLDKSDTGSLNSRYPEDHDWASSDSRSTGHMSALLEPEFEAVYSLRTHKFRVEERNILMHETEGLAEGYLEAEEEESTVRLVQMQGHMPPLLIDGRMMIVPVPKSSRKMTIYWRSWDGDTTRVRETEVLLPGWLWWGRNTGMGKYSELFVEKY